MGEQQDKKQNKEIDLIDLVLKIWAKRKQVFKVCGLAAVLALIIAFSIPKEYTTKVILAPEVANKSGLSGSMGALASMAGINLGGMSGEDALYPELYPKILESTPFLVEMFDVKVVDRKGKLDTTLYEYLLEYQKQPWWGYITELPGKGIKWLLSLIKKEKEENSGKANPFLLTLEQDGIAKSIKDMIEISVDKKTDVITFSVAAQDALASAIIADSVMSKLQKYITDYRTQKSRRDLEFAEELYKEAKVNYLEKQKAYATYSDRNIDVIFAIYKSEEDRLKNEQTLAYNVYNQMSQQLQIAKAKVQERTPVFTVIQPPSVALIASSPKKIIILVGSVFLAFIGVSSWILIKGKYKKEN